MPKGLSHAAVVFSVFLFSQSRPSQKWGIKRAKFGKEASSQVQASRPAQVGVRGKEFTFTGFKESTFTEFKEFTFAEFKDFTFAE